jgi:hypothetical protein
MKAASFSAHVTVNEESKVGMFGGPGDYTLWLDNHKTPNAGLHISGDLSDLESVVRAMGRAIRDTQAGVEVGA